MIDGAVVGRNTRRERPIYSADPFISCAFRWGRGVAQLELRAEAFNVLNHHNFGGYNWTYAPAATPAIGFGVPLSGVTAQVPAPANAMLRGDHVLGDVRREARVFSERSAGHAKILQHVIFACEAECESGSALLHGRRSLKSGTSDCSQRFGRWD